MNFTVLVTVEGVDEPYYLQVQGQQRIGDVVNLLKKPNHVVNGGVKKPVSFGLYWPEKKRWLDDDSPVWDTQIEEGTALELRSQERIARIRFLDGSCKMLWINTSKSVGDIVSHLCEQLNISCTNEMSLVVAGDYSVNGKPPGATSPDVEGSLSPSRARHLLGSLHRTSLDVPSPPPSPKSPSQRRRQFSLICATKPQMPTLFSRSASVSRSADRKSKSPSPPLLSKRAWSPSLLFKKQLKLKKQISRRHQLRLDTPWLDPNKTLLEQDVEEDNELILMFRFFYNMTLMRGSKEVDMLYSQAKSAFLNGEMACSGEVTCKFAALELQIQQGNHNEQVTVESLSALKHSVVPKKAAMKQYASQILLEYRQLIDVSVAEAKAMFVQLWSTLPTFGMEFLSCAELTSKRKGLVGVSKDKVVFIDHDTKKLTLSWPFTALTKWSHDRNKSIVVLSFPSTELQVLVPDYSDVLADCLSEHRRLHGVFNTEMELEESVPHYTILTDGLPLQKFAETWGSSQGDPRSLSFHDVFWAADIANPLVSSEELEEMRRGSWDNPAFSAVEEIVEARFAFLDQALEGCLDDDN